MDRFDYDEKAVAAFGVVEDAIAALDVPFMLQSRYSSLLNAIEVQVEDGHPSREVLGHLRAAVLALMRFDGLAQVEKTVQKAFDEFEKKIASRFK
jgi:hypothetical protein